MTTVVTYSYAYCAGSVSLCGDHGARSDHAGRTLGEVTRGAHYGECAACVRRTREARLLVQLQAVVGERSDLRAVVAAALDADPDAELGDLIDAVRRNG